MDRLAENHCPTIVLSMTLQYVSALPTAFANDDVAVCGAQWRCESISLYPGTAVDQAFSDGQWPCWQQAVAPKITLYFAYKWSQQAFAAHKLLWQEA